MRELPRATVIILNWNGRSYLEACLNALLKQTTKPDRIILVDNGSTDDSVSLVRRLYPAVEILETGANLGYAGGNNVALRLLETEVAILVNPDIVVRPDWLENLLKTFRIEPGIGVAGCKLLFPGEEQLQHGGGLITHPRAMPGHRGMYSKDEGQLDTQADVDYVTGAAIAVRREMMEVAGFLDEGFFMYFEDADWCERFRRNGFRVVYVPEAAAVHDESALAVRGSPSYLRRFHSGRWRYLLKHFDAKEIVGETLPAESDWLEEKSGNERQALGQAYHDTIAEFTAIMEARVAHGSPEVPERAQAKIIAGLKQLRQKATADGPIQTEGLVQASGREESRSFGSTNPVLGPLFERLRQLLAGKNSED